MSFSPGARAISDIPVHVQQFLKKYIQSIWQLELLLFLRSKEQDLTCQSIAKELCMSVHAVEDGLQRFEKAGLLQSSSGNPRTYKFVASNVQLVNVLDETLKAYHERRVQVIQLVFSTPGKEFSDAFKWNQGGDD